MTDTPEPNISIEATFRDSDGGEVVLRQVALGLAPIVLIEPSMDGEDVTFQIDATDIGRAELAQLLSVLADTLANVGDPT